MMRQFGCEFAVGIITFAAMMLFGPRGAAVIALLTFMPFIMRNQKADEREYYLFYKTGNYTMGLFIVALTAIHQAQLYTGSDMIQKNWLSLSVAALLFIHGLTGIIIFKNN
ncbi:MAG TPA: hypothetical protein DC017_03205 [Candidatus Wallbacteria bacterium]|nr:hypothetical protein [Candidatus Wallbacteria bacterium]